MRDSTPLTHQISRRQAAAWLAAGCCSLAADHVAWAASPKTAETPAALTPLNRFPRMVQEYFVARVRAAERRGEAARAALKTKADAEKYIETVRAKILESFGPLPEKTPLAARVTGVVERDAYKIEKIIFESRPEFLVTANLYVPKGRKFPLPGVVGACGHSDNGKAMTVYQSFAQGLARLGYVVLIYDPLGQGERSQYPGRGSKPGRGGGVSEHLQAGNQQVLVGEVHGTWHAWDGIRALDYLLTRAEVDPRHVGITGNSGGGTLTTWLCGLDRRWTMAAPSCFVTTFRRNLENELPADTEQCPPKALALGLDEGDFLAALAPRPILILGQEKDFFDVRGTAETHARLKRLYALLGAEENAGLFIGPREHGYAQENREAMYRWFNRAAGLPQVAGEPALTLEKDETLWCTPTGRVADLKSRSVFSFTRARSQELARRRQPLDGDALKARIAEVLKLPPRRLAGDCPDFRAATGHDRQVVDAGTKMGLSPLREAGAKQLPDYRILRPVSGRKYPKRHAAVYAVETEPGIHALVYMPADAAVVARPPCDRVRAVLYVAHHSSDAELRDEPLVAELFAAEPDAAFYACDVRGIGESRPDTCGKDQFLAPYGSDYFYAVHSLMLDYPYLGQKTRDLLTVLDWFRYSGHLEVHLAAKGWGTLPATFAAVLSPLVVQVTLKGALGSYTEVAESESYRWPLSALLPDVLRHFDLPDCYRALAAKKLRRIEEKPDAAR